LKFAHSPLSSQGERNLKTKYPKYIKIVSYIKAPTLHQTKSQSHYQTRLAGALNGKALADFCRGIKITKNPYKTLHHSYRLINQNIL